MAITATETVLLKACAGDASGIKQSNWLDVLLLADRHEVTPLVISALLSHPTGTGTLLGEDVAEMLNELHASTVIRHGLTRGELANVWDALAGIQALALKGPALAERCYPPGARLCRDIDIAIHADDYEIARARLTDLSYAPVNDYDERLQRLTGRDMAFCRTDSRGAPWSVELHWMLAERGSASLDEPKIWRQSSVFNIEGRDVRCPALEDTILLLAVNLRKHRFARLKNLCDLDHLVRQFGGRIDWETLHHDAHAAGVCVLLRRALELSDELLGTDVQMLPECTRSAGVRHWTLKSLATADAVLADGRAPEPYDPVAGILPFVAVDHVSTTVRLVARRLSLSPELASYHAGRPGAYRSRRQYLFDTTRRIAIAGFLLATGPFRRQTDPEPLPGSDYPVITEERHTTPRQISA
jgi:Uncharacterised nucleotidyltransferase